MQVEVVLGINRKRGAARRLRGGIVGCDAANAVESGC